MSNELVQAGTFPRIGQSGPVAESYPDLSIYSKKLPFEPQQPYEPMQVFSKETLNIKHQIEQMLSPVAPSMLGIASDNRTLEEQLFDATAQVKVLTSQVAMYLDSVWREKLFLQIDYMHDPQEWEEGDKPLQKESFETFLKAICDLRPAIRPGLGLTHNGQLIAAWTHGGNRLTIEFHPRNRVRWVIARRQDDETEHYVGDTNVARLRAGLEPHHPEEWLAKS